MIQWNTNTFVAPLPRNANQSAVWAHASTTTTTAANEMEEGDGTEHAD